MRSSHLVRTRFGGNDTMMPLITSAVKQVKAHRCLSGQQQPVRLPVSGAPLVSWAMARELGFERLQNISKTGEDSRGLEGTRGDK